MRTHTISSGETLSRIAQRYNTTVDALAKANNIQNPNMIISGRSLTIPGGANPGAQIRSRLQQDSFEASPARAASAPGSIPSPASGQFDGTRPAPGTTNTQAWIPVDAPLQGSPSNRNADTYSDVIDQFGVASNPRYQPRDGNTYCNIFAWDVTKAMGAEIPHWVDANGNPTGVGQGRELDANGVNQWLNNQGPQHGWREVSAEEAQRLANEGHPTVASWNNPGGIGHIGVIRPGEINERGPAMAQAGSSNFNDGHVKDSFGNAPVQYFVNDGGTATGNTPGNPTTPSKPTQPGNSTTPSKPTQPSTGLSMPQMDLQRGNEGPAVEQLQKALVQHGFMTQAQMDTGPGIFGPQTESSLKGFQAAHGVPSTGYYGPMTREAFAKLGGGSSSGTPSGTTGPSGANGSSGVDGLSPSDAQLAQRIDQHLSGTGLAGYGKTIVDQARKDRVPVDLVMSMLQKESSFLSPENNLSRANNNPGNLRWADWESQFGGKPGGPGNFTTFPNVEQGLRAHVHLLGTVYRNEVDNRDWGALVSRYAPPFDGNDTGLYIQQMYDYTKQWQQKLGITENWVNG
jgi:LysM repeat protein/peptidoglycan hydrolase-like protein with peptidoglycan-binding domain